jgi:hypothetical protein
MPPVKKPDLVPGPLAVTLVCKGSPYFSLINTNLPVSDIILLAGILPPGLNFQESENARPIISGTPTTPGDYPFTVQITPANGTTPAVVSYAISVLGITSGDPTDATQGTAYTFSFISAGGTAPYTFNLEAGPLPAGITLTSDGTLAGTPTENGDFNITVSVKDSTGFKCQEFFLFTVNAVVACYDWTQLVWTPIDAQNGTISGTGSAFNGSCTCTGWPPDSALAFIDIQGDGPLYTGPDCNCKLTVNVSSIFFTDPGGAGVNYSIIVNGVFILSGSISVGGVTVIPFTIPASVGATIQVLIGAGAGVAFGSAGNSGSVTFTGSLSTV